MTAATLTPAAIEEAHAVLHEALLLPLRERRAVTAEMEALDRALDGYGVLVRREIAWERFYPELATEADPHEAALGKAAAEAQDAADQVLRAIAAHCGTKEAEALTGAGR